MTSNRRATAAAARFTKSVSIALTGLALIGASAITSPARAGDVPTFAVDASWPKPLPNNWILGQVGGITVDAQGHIWVIHRPRSLTDDEKGAALTPPRSKCCVSAPPVLEFDADGNLLRSWANETVSTKLRVNLFSPGPIRTRMRASVFPGEDPMTLDTPEQAAEFIVPMCAPEWEETGKFYDYKTRTLMSFHPPA